MNLSMFHKLYFYIFEFKVAQNNQVYQILNNHLQN
jgi:hypothetical protein